jgi:hypothetical protein
MNIFKKLFGGGAAPEKSALPFRVGDRVRDTFGARHTVIHIDARAEGGLGIIRTRSDNGFEMGHAIIAHGLKLLSPEEAASPPPREAGIKRVKPEESSLSAYLRADKIILAGICNTNIGGLVSGPYVALDSSAPDAELGTAVLTVLEAARTVPIPTNLKEEQQKLFSTVKVRSASKFNAGAVECSIWKKPGTLSITPSKNEGRGFSHLPSYFAVTISGDATPEAIGKGLREAFTKCS